MFGRKTIRSMFCSVSGSAVVALTVMAGHAQASDNLRQELSIVAEKMAQLIQSRGDDGIAVGQFTGPSHMPSNAGPVIVKTLSEELEKHKVSVKKRANLEIKGDYMDVDDKQSKKLAIMLKGRVIDRTGTIITEFQRGIFGDGTIASFFGLTTSLPPTGDDKARDDKLRESIDKPQTHVAKTRISAGDKSPYAIEVLVKPVKGGQYAPRSPKQEEGLAFCHIQRTEVYALKLYNDSPYEAAVTLSIDGLNAFSFSDIKDPKTGHHKYNVFIIDPKSTMVVKGWHRTNQFSEEFMVTEYSKSAAAELKHNAGIGTITAVFSACWEKDASPPPDEPSSPSKFTRSGDATGRGQRFEHKFHEVERHFGVVRGTVSARYSKAGDPSDLPPAEK